MKHLLPCLLLISWFLINTRLSLAQTPASDVLYKLDRSTVKSKISEITGTDVFYTELTTPNVPRKIRKADLWKVVFSDGTSDVFNEPKAGSQPTGLPAPKPAVAGTPARPPAIASPTVQPASVAQKPEPATPKSDQPADMGTFLAGRRALSFGLDVAGSSATRKNSKTSTTETESDISLSVIYQKFTRDNVSVGGVVTLGMTREKAADVVISGPSIAVAGTVRRYLPVASNVAFYGFGLAELGFRSDSYKIGTASAETVSSSQRLSVEAGAGLAFLFNPRWSVDFNASLLGLTLYREKDKSPGSKAAVDLSLTGAGVVPSFSLFFTRYF